MENNFVYSQSKVMKRKKIHKFSAVIYLNQWVSQSVRASLHLISAVHKESYLHQRLNLNAGYSMVSAIMMKWRNFGSSAEKSQDVDIRHEFD